MISEEMYEGYVQWKKEQVRILRLKLIKNLTLHFGTYPQIDNDARAVVFQIFKRDQDYNKLLDDSNVIPNSAGLVVTTKNKIGRTRCGYNIYFETNLFANYPDSVEKMLKDMGKLTPDIVNLLRC